ncbi:MAG: ADP-glyceromanno-heptose 6-epimerase [Crocinitomicaceae bacterium]
MIVVTGAAGFISSCLVNELNSKGHKKIVVVDDFSRADKAENLAGKTMIAKVPRKDFFKWANDYKTEIEFVFHLGARTDTTEFDISIFNELNLNYSKDMWNFCSENSISLIYASSGATYGIGEHGFDDNHDIVEKLKPLNPYGDSKNDFDKWALKQDQTPPFWAGLKFFNIYGPNEYHKGRMASVIFHAFNQINKTGGMKLFKSHNPDYKDGEQLRDFVYVKDVAKVCMFLMENQPTSGLYNLGTGNARTFLDLTKATFKALNIPENIGFVDTPLDIRDKYQYFTEATTKKLKQAGYNEQFYSLEDGVKDYVENYLSPNTYL